MPQPSDSRLFLVAPGEVAILAVKLLGDNLQGTKHTDERWSHKFSSHLGYSIFEEPHCGQRIRAEEMSGSVASHSIINSCAFSKSLSSTITFAFAWGRDMKPTCCSGASLCTSAFIPAS